MGVNFFCMGFDYNPFLCSHQGFSVRYLLLFSFFIFTALEAKQPLENATCKACHPIIFAEYQHSQHAKASIWSDPVHKAIWDKHPYKKQGKYTCAQCHTPSDHTLKGGKGLPTDNAAQIDEPISCQGCHRIESIEEHAHANRNVIQTKPKYFYSADVKRKGKKIIFHETSSFFGLFKKTTGSPYHDIDYSNDLFYTGKMCLGCHDHKQNGKGFSLCDLGVKQGGSKETCISCHMPQKLGTKVNLKQTATHAYHGMTIHGGIPAELSRYIKLSLSTTSDGFAVILHNEATHTLFAQPLRLAQLRVSIYRDGKTISLPPRTYVRVIGTRGKPSMPWLADTVLKDTSIKALETREEHFDTVLKQGDKVEMVLGYYLVNPKVAGKLGLEGDASTAFTVLTKKVVDF